MFVDPNRYVEHNVAVAGGVGGLRNFMPLLPDESRRVEPVRAVHDGPFVVIQSEGSLLGHNVFFDVFRFDGDLIVEHWVFMGEGAPPNRSGHTQTDGPTEPQNVEDTEHNKAFARAYYEAVHVAGQHDKIPELVRENCIRHEPGVLDGREAFVSDVAVLTQGRTIDEIKILAGRGDFVFIAARGTVHEDPCVYIDLYRIENDQIAERWGFPVEDPPREQRRNPNGIL